MREPKRELRVSNQTTYVHRGKPLSCYIFTNITI
jgi:hypothetical protein